MRFDPLSLIESSYDLEAPEAQWLTSLAASARRALGVRNLGAYAIRYDVSDRAQPELLQLVEDGFENPALWSWLAVDAQAAHRAEPGVTQAMFGQMTSGSARRMPITGAVAAAHERLASLGVKDICGFTGVNPDGRGVHVGVLLPVTTPSRFDVDLLARVSSHLAASLRLRLRLGGAAAIERAEGVMSPRGTVEHATGGARLQAARATLVAAVAELERVRGPVGRRDPHRAVASWKALVEAQWSLVDHFDSDGKRFVLAQRNDHATAPLALLTAREHQVMALAAMGHANKMIGYELGISVSTVGVLLGRAAKRLGLRSRAALIKAYEAEVARWENDNAQTRRSLTGA